MTPHRSITTSGIGKRIVTGIEDQTWLDTPGYKLEHGLALSFNLLGSRSRTVQDALHGLWLGHPLHPVLTDLPVGAWTTALLLDAADLISPRPAPYRRAAQLAVGAGVLGGAAAALSGLTDWQHTQDRPRRSGLVHGLLNTAALSLNVQSWRRRRQNRLGRARLLSGLGYSLVLVSSYLGGNLVFGHRIGVDHASTDPGPTDFTAVFSDTDLEEDTPHLVDADGVGVILIRHAGHISALGDLCPHLGAPMAQGWIYDNALVCPWHGSRFDLATGCPITGPATAGVMRFDTQIIDGQIHLRGHKPAGAATTGGRPVPPPREQA